MNKKKACKNCKIFVKEEKCSMCGGTDFTTTWKGRITVIDPEKSEIANKIGIKKEGEYVLKV